MRSRPILVIALSVVAFSAFSMACGAQFAPVVGGGVAVLPPPPGDAELSRCEATGRTREQCCEDHQFNPCF